MERRKAPRFSADEQATLTILSPGNLLPGEEVRVVRIVERSDFGVKVESDAGLPLSTLVQLEFADGLLLGEVAWCGANEGRVHLGLRIEASLQDLSDLSKLMRSLTGEEVRELKPAPAP